MTCYDAIRQNMTLRTKKQAVISLNYIFFYRYFGGSDFHDHDFTLKKIRQLFIIKEK